MGMLDPAAIVPLAAAVEEAWRADRTVFTAGNGGSAATASHFAADLAKTTRLGAGAARGVRALALGDNASLLTAWANDQSFVDVFAEQLRTLAGTGDVLVCLSTSGESPNLAAAASAAAASGVHSLAVAPARSTLASRCDVTIPVQAESIQMAEDLHLAVCHAVTMHVAAAIAAS